VNRRDILGSLAAWATAASAVEAAAGSSANPLDDFAVEVEELVLRKRGQQTAALPADLNVYHVPPERTLLVFRLTQCVSQGMVDTLRSNIESWIRDTRLDCAAILLPYGLELDVHRISAGASPSDS